MHSLKKPAILIALAVFLLVPLAMIGGTIQERIQYQHEAKASIVNSWASDQIVHDPLLIIEYTVSGTTTGKNNITSAWKLPRTAIIKPAKSDFNGHLNVSHRNRGIYSIPVYTADVVIQTEFDAREFISDLSKAENFEFGSAYFVTALSDARGLDQDSMQSILNQSNINNQPGTRALSSWQGFHMPVTLTELIASEKLELLTEFSLRGMETFRISPNALDTTTELTSLWPHPSFSGDILPLQREVLDTGFIANWEVSPYNRSISAKPVILERNHQDYQTEYFNYGVNLFTPVDEYSLVNRATKYGVLMIVLIFTGFYLFELLKGLTLHPVQYSLVGLALAVFFLLLLSLSEHIGFTYAYLVAALSSSSLICTYLLPTTGKRATGFLLSLLLVTYLICYLILFVEDQALLYGSLLIFAGLASVMMLTRKIDWYSLDAKTPLKTPTPKEMF